MVTIKQLTKALDDLNRAMAYGDDQAATPAMAYANKTLADAVEGVETVPTVRVRLTGATDSWQLVRSVQVLRDASVAYLGLLCAKELSCKARDGEITEPIAVQVKDLNLLMENFTLLVSP